MPGAAIKAFFLAGWKALIGPAVVMTAARRTLQLTPRGSRAPVLGGDRIRVVEIDGQGG